MNYRNPYFNRVGTIDCEIEHPDFGWIPTTLAPDDPDTAELYATVSAGEVAPAVPVPLAGLRSAKLAAINRAYSVEMAAILDQYPDAETLSFDKQEAEARAWRADSTAVTPFIDAMLIERPLDKGELVSRIIAKADAFTLACGAATGKRQRLEDAINAATDAATVEAIAW